MLFTGRAAGELVASTTASPETGATPLSTVVMPSIFWMTCAIDGREHAVTDDQAIIGLRLDRGTYGAPRGRMIAPQAMASAPEQRCTDCCTKLEACCNLPAPSRKEVVAPIQQRTDMTTIATVPLT